MEKKPSSKRGTITPRSSTQYKNKKKQHPLKVVYISNPMKVVTTASGFRALVQHLTGKDASDVPSPPPPPPPPTTTTTLVDDFSESSDDVSSAKSSGTPEFPAVAAHPSPDDAFFCDLFFKPLDLIDPPHMTMLDADHDFNAFFISSTHVDSLINV